MLQTPCVEIRKLSRVLTSFYEDLFKKNGANLRFTQFSILGALHKVGVTTATQLSSIFGMDRSTLSRTLEPLVERGYAQKFPKQGRVSQYAITQLGEHEITNMNKVFDAINQVINERHKEFFKQVSQFNETFSGDASLWRELSLKIEVW